MNNLSCVCVNIFSQLSQLLNNFSTISTSSSTFTHDGGFTQAPPQGSASLGNDGRFSLGSAGGDNTVFTFAVMLMIFAMFFLNTGDARQRETDDKQARGGRNNRFDGDFNQGYD